MKRLGAVLAAGLLTALVGCSDGEATPDASEETRTPAVRVLTHDGFAVSADVLARFVEESGIEVRLEPTASRAALLDGALSAAEAGAIDVVYGLDSTVLDEALDAELLAPYEPETLDAVPAELQPRADEGALPVSFGDVCVLVDQGWFLRQGVPAPDSFADLVGSRYAGMLAVPDPTTSTAGLAFLLATSAWYGDGDENGFGWQGFWEALVANDVAIVAGVEQAYHRAFTAGSAGGDRPMAVGYSTQPVAARILDPDVAAGSATRALGETCFRHVEYAGVVGTTDRPAEARQVVDFFLSQAFQEDLPLSMFAYPAASDVDVPAELVTLAPPVPQPLWLDPDEIGRLREDLVAEWQEVVETARLSLSEDGGHTRG